ncbi:hypothetical protein RhiirA4_482551 [Rhizophagus irregularis]|uniref:Endonuclease/exonuclease/phosphatase domain-containing protein n=1 Tax=Rhizophagus irregularis TaxID=588596 RepID=A0A2I1HL86_9GLOM|nr:hypothetical protein RhiirA4_482551 [Rhizophagus irregularis]
MDNNKHNFTSHSSPLLKFGQINVNGLCSPVRQQHLLNFFLHSSFDFYYFLILPPSGSINQNICKDLIAKFLSWLDHAHSNNYHVIILGDFNIDEIAHSTYSHNHFRLLRLLSSRYFNDHQARSSSLSGPDPTIYHATGSSRLDYIWASPGFPALGVFTQVVTCPLLLDHPFTDHRVLITTFDFSSCMAILANSRLKQKKELRTIFTYSSISVQQWNNFTKQADDILKTYLDKQYPSRIDFSSLSTLSLDRLWHALKAAIFGSAVQTLPHQHVSNTHRHSYSPELTKLIAINKFLDHFLYRLTTHRPNRPTQISQMTAALPSHLANLVSLLPDYSVSVYSITPLSGFKTFLRSQKNLVSAFLSTKFAQQLTEDSGIHY